MSSNDYVTYNRLLGTGVAMITLTTIVIISRFGIRIWKGVWWQAEDILIFLAYAVFVSLAGMYLSINHLLQRIYAVTTGREALYETIENDSRYLTRIMFPCTMMLWVSLWLVKASFLVWYRRLMKGIKKQMRLWWVVVILSAVMLIGAIVSEFTSCKSLSAWFTPGECQSPRDIKAQLASLWYSYAVDVITDIMVMLLPIGLIWNIQISRSQKISLVGIFSLGIICIIMATIRVVQLRTHNPDSSPAPPWLAFWGIIETATAVIIGCLPAFAVFYRTVRSNHKGYEGGYGGYSNRYREGYGDDSSHFPSGAGTTGSSAPRHIKLESMASKPTRTGNSFWVESSTSQEHLAKPGEIVVTTNVRQTHSSDS
ncbi:hypothetical protein P152DRAFT_52543 [Eremomyces bilateralis CBS 781.70]|uniref:Rhodopsin domain-containing protein n=1 Tax=Eremomyces bilateralis CBS 781.70 TaxID=1392243 RepID=A0A6G1G139_9PEZI|nr:uncharacterized protein P152DRAFT_52543 [Eremomyces bilateralis CBS 781.70]KAF1811827.1 hypothetical protein P152DRAFT_52543 [Eremomyces bilateralis CBS 781.70]